ncbi:hypothetical protein PIB30_095005, partial [Stylosanthes scabra]|nr:hypothetical protein [Stylosanthes scabra]
IGFLCGTICEDVHNGYMMNCNGWNSNFCDPPQPQLLRNSTINLNELLIQGTRCGSGLLDIGSSRFCPLMYGLQGCPYCWVFGLPSYVEKGPNASIQAHEMVEVAGVELGLQREVSF